MICRCDGTRHTGELRNTVRLTNNQNAQIDQPNLSAELIDSIVFALIIYSILHEVVPWAADERVLGEHDRAGLGVRAALVAA